MRYVVGIDLGTSSVKIALLREDGAIAATGTHAYPIASPQPGWAEQAPDDWWIATCAAVRAALEQARAGPEEVAAIATGGQMHGTVLLDEHGAALRPAIIWPDQRAAREVEEATATFAARGLLARLGGGVSPGFMLSSLLWLRAHEPALWPRAATALLPKDYLRYRLTGVLSSEPSDGCGIPLVDLERWAWDEEACRALDLPAHLFPPLGVSQSVAGALTPDAGAALGLSPGIPVLHGGSDQAMAALGAGLLRPGTLMISLSTGGQLVAPVERPLAHPVNGLRSLCHALAGTYLAMAATLNVGLAAHWLRDELLRDQAPDADARLMELAAQAPDGAGALLFLPYLAGERAPLLDPAARAAFVGLRLDHGRTHLARAGLEGIAYSLRHALELLQTAGVRAERIILAGGLTRAALMRDILANVLDREVTPLRTGEQSALGAALLATVGAGFFPDIASACEAAVSYAPPIAPDAGRAARYNDLYRVYRELYPRLRQSMHER